MTPPRINIFTTALVAAGLLLLVVFALSGCAGGGRTRVSVPSADKTIPALTFEQDGTVENPSEVTVVERPAYWLEGQAGEGKPDFSFPVRGARSAGSERTVTIKGTKSFQPPAAPSPKETAEGNLVYVAVGCVLLGIIAGLALLKFGFAHEAAWAVLGGAGSAVAVRFVGNEVAMVVAGVVALIIGCLVWAWYRVRDRVPEQYGGRLKP